MAKGGKKKILRVGIIQSGRIVEERLLRKREHVTVGQAAKNTFILPADAGLPKAFTLFEAKGDGYCLCFNEQIEGRVSLGEDVLDLGSLARSGRAKKRSGRFTVQLDDNSRGKVMLGEFTFLFQFVDAPPVLPKPQLPAAARGGLAQRFDWLFVNVVLLSFLLQGGTGIGLDLWWRQTGRYLQSQYQGRKAKAYELLKAEVIRKEKDEKEEEPKDEANPEDSSTDSEPDPEPTPVAKPKKKPKKIKPVAEEKPEVDPGDQGKNADRESKSRKVLRENVRNKTFIKALGAMDGGAGTIADTLKDGLDDKISQAFEDAADSVNVAQQGDKAMFKGSPNAVKSSGASYKRLSKEESGGGKRMKTRAVKTKKGKNSEVKIKMRVGGGSVGGKSGVGKIEASDVQRVFKRRKGAIKHCYEQALKKDPTVKGKVTIRFTIGPAGRITSISIKDNSTGSASIGSCIKGKVKSWKFPPPEGGSVTFSYPFILSKG